MALGGVDGEHEDLSNTKKIAESWQAEEPSQPEQKRGNVWLKNQRNGSESGMPPLDFIEANTFSKDCQYLDKGVKLGAARTLILVYRLNLTGKYRVVYVDLRIEDVSDEEAKRIKGGL